MGTLNPFDRVYAENRSEGESRYGSLEDAYIRPTYAKIFRKNCPDHCITILEIGCGIGQTTRHILPMCEHISSYHATDISLLGGRIVSKNLPVTVLLADAVDLPYHDKTFDAVISFDTMHHIDRPELMSQEMVRVARRFIFLIESNGLSIFRRALERTRHYRTMGERSYTPRQYKAFFMHNSDVRAVRIRPNIFCIPGLNRISSGLTIGVSEFVGRIPIIRTQCSALSISVELW